MDCYEKAKALGEPVFSVRAQDITSHLLVEAWVAIQQSVRQAMDDGASMVEAVEDARYLHRIPRMIYEDKTLTEKERGALEIARAMMGWGRRKLAD